MLKISQNFFASHNAYVNIEISKFFNIIISGKEKTMATKKKVAKKKTAKRK